MDIKKNSTEQHFVFNQVTLALSISTQIPRMAETIRRQGQQNTTKYSRNKPAIEKEGTRLISRSNELWSYDAWSNLSK